jgi:hypothetical protein
MELRRIHRIGLIVLNAFLGLSAIAGGVGLLGGGLQFPIEWLQGSPFHSYTIPGLALMILVGGSALVAAAVVARRHELAGAASAAAGAMIVGFEIVEVLVVGSQPGVMRSLQLFYIALGLFIIMLAAPLLFRQGNILRPAPRS